MANLIDTTYFIDDIEVPNSNQEEIEEDLTHSINIYEKEVLIELLGYQLYKELRANQTTTDVDDKFYKLIHGEEFTFTLNGRTVVTKWDGLLGENKKSLIAYYVYFHHRRKRSSYNAGVGQEVEPATNNSTKGNFLYDKLIQIWNDFIVMYGDDDYFDDDSLLADYTHCDDEPSAYNYLLAKKADFTNWRFTSQLGELNKFGI